MSQNNHGFRAFDPFWTDNLSWKPLFMSLCVKHISLSLGGLLNMFTFYFTQKALEEKNNQTVFLLCKYLCPLRGLIGSIMVRKTHKQSPSGPLRLVSGDCGGQVNTSVRVWLSCWNLQLQTAKDSFLTSSALQVVVMFYGSSEVEDQLEWSSRINN